MRNTHCYLMAVWTHLLTAEINLTAMRAFSDVFQMLCNVNGPLPSVDEQGKVIKIIQDTKDKINALINKK